MRTPKLPKGKGPPAADTPPGGRAFQRARQFAVARGLPSPVAPDAGKSGQAATAEPAAKRGAKTAAKTAAKPAAKRRAKTVAKPAAKRGAKTAAKKRS
ncbi:MAG: hypothetical protein IT517_09580 [Burkholderiales bacterium]|nr:hypothetical protein [Burkholderiales bacterium]